MIVIVTQGFLRYTSLFRKKNRYFSSKFFCQDRINSMRLFTLNNRFQVTFLKETPCSKKHSSLNTIKGFFYEWFLSWKNVEF
jgi:hypothetical protein